MKRKLTQEELKIILTKLKNIIGKKNTDYILRKMMKLIEQKLKILLKQLLHMELSLLIL
jgi:hypothetical protein